MKNSIVLFCFIFSSFVFANEVPTEKNIDVSRYVGKWYAHFSLPQFFTRKCLGQTAEYEIIGENKISVFNTCLKKKKDKTIKGQAYITNPGDNSKLIVSFNSFFTRLFRVKGDYNIIKIDQNYEYVLIGSNNRKSLWLMSRSESSWPEDVKQSYVNYAKELGYDTTKLVESKF
jgi:apolipoprotein D and lipocalin family protein